MKRPSVLIADDEVELSAFLASFLTDAGFAVRVAGDGLAAIEALAQETFDALVLDLEMPRLDGLEVLRRIQADPAQVMLAVVILTGDGQRPSIERGLRLGADDYLVKPFSAWELEARLKGSVRRIQRRAQAEASTDLKAPADDTAGIT